MDVMELTWFNFRGLHLQRKFIDGYIFIIKFCITTTPLTVIYSKLNRKVI
jgi:hypothetical protein